MQGPAKKFMLSFCESLSEVMFKFVGVVMSFAPIGIGAAIAVTVSKSGMGVLKSLGLLVGTLYGALIVFIVAVLIPIALLARVPLKRFILAVKHDPDHAAAGGGRGLLPQPRPSRRPPTDPTDGRNTTRRALREAAGPRRLSAGRTRRSGAGTRGRRGRGRHRTDRPRHKGGRGI